MAYQFLIPNLKGGCVPIPINIKETLSALDVVWSNMFEGEKLDPDEVTKQETDFYKGAPPQWLNFFWAEKKNSPFVKRDGYDEIRNLIAEQKQKEKSVTSVKLLHQSGSGASTLAMQVMWDLRTELRCARVKQCNMTCGAIAKQAVDLFFGDNGKNQNTVLLLLDTKEINEDMQFAKSLEKSFLKEIKSRKNIRIHPVVIILECAVKDFSKKETMVFDENDGEKLEPSKISQKYNEQEKGHATQFTASAEPKGNDTSTWSPCHHTIPTATGDTEIAKPTLLSSLASLEVLWANAFENRTIEPEESEEAEFDQKAASDWLKFHLADKNGSPYPKGDFYFKLIQQIEVQRKSRCKVTTIDLFHQHRNEASTLALQVLWEQRKVLRCAKVTDNSNIQKIAEEVISLFKEGGAEKQNTVLLLLKNENKGDETAKHLVKRISEDCPSTEIPVVIILNLIPLSHVFKKPEIKLKMELSVEERKRFEAKAKELRREYGKGTNHFHSFNIMKENFRREHVRTLITSIKKYVKKNNTTKRTTKLFSVLALINSYVPGSYLLETLCQTFLAHPLPVDGQPLSQTMDSSFRSVLVTFSEREEEKKKCIRMAHPLIAEESFHMLLENGVTRYSAMSDFLEFFHTTDQQKNLFKISKNMLVTRESVYKDKEKFSNLILHILEDEKSCEKCSDLLESASDYFPTDPFYPQALARLCYIKSKEYTKAKIWAKKAIQRDRKRSFIRDTLGQINKNQLRNNTNNSNKSEILEMFEDARQAFEDEETIAEKEEEYQVKDYCEMKMPSMFNVRGHFGYLQVCKITFDSLRKKNMPFTDCLIGCKNGVENRFCFFQQYLTYSKPDSQRDEPSYFKRDVNGCFSAYESMGENQDAAMQYLRQNQAFTFAGLLDCLNVDVTKTGIEKINGLWTDIYKQNEKKNGQTLNSSSADDTLNYILANILLSNRLPDAQGLSSLEDLRHILRTFWENSKENYSPEFYLLVLLLFWPEEHQDQSEINTPDLKECVRLMNESFNKKYRKYFRSRYLVPLFFLGPGTGLKRLVHNSKLSEKQVQLLTQEDEREPEIRCLLQVKGVIKDHSLFAVWESTQSKQKEYIEVHPHNPAGVRNQSNVTFYLGFNIRGPVAYNIKYHDGRKASSTSQ